MLLSSLLYLWQARLFCNVQDSLACGRVRLRLQGNASTPTPNEDLTIHTQTGLPPTLSREDDDYNSFRTTTIRARRAIEGFTYLRRSHRGNPLQKYVDGILQIYVVHPMEKKINCLEHKCVRPDSGVRFRA